MREMFANKEFRQALSLGIEPQGDHRPRLSRPVASPTRPGRGRAIPGTTRSSRASTPSYDPREGERHARQARLQRRDAEGFRLRPDGQKVFFAIDVIPTLYPDHVDSAGTGEAPLGRRSASTCKVNTIERALYYTRGDSNDHDARGLAGPRRARPDARPARLLRAASAGLALRDSVGALVRLRRQGRAGAAGEPEEAHEAVTTRRARRPT